jgi:capsule polysaccharide export protein KpsE/RkpR
MELAIFVVACATAVLITLQLPKQYDATASLLPPAEGGPGAGLTALVAQAPGASVLGGLFTGSTTKDIFVGLLRSRSMQDDLIKEFDLVKVYGNEGAAAPMKATRKRLESMTDISLSKEGVISVTVSAYDRQMATDMANFYVENLDRLNSKINVTDAGRSRMFLEKRVNEAHKMLQAAEERLKNYQSQSKVVVLEGQARAAIEGMAELEGKIAAAEVQLKAMQTFAAPSNPDVALLREGIGEMRRQLRNLEYGRGGDKVKATGAMASDFSVPLGAIPGMGLDIVRLIRETKIQETVYTLLTQQLEQAKIAEAKDTPVVRVLDRAAVPEVPSRPRLLLNVAVAAIFSIVVGASAAFTLESQGRIRQAKQQRPG